MDVWPVQARDSDPLRLVRKVVLIVLAVEVALLAATGLWLVFNYRPSAAASWTDIRALRHASVEPFGVRGVHRNIGHLAVLTSLGACALVIADAIVHGLGRRKVALLVVGPSLLITVLAASFTGYLLPWDQLALWAVTVGTNMKGYGPAFGSQTRFVLLGGVEISKATLWRWFIVHTVVLTVAVVTLILFALRLKPTGRPKPVEDASSVPQVSQPST